MLDAEQEGVRFLIILYSAKNPETYSSHYRLHPRFPENIYIVSSMHHRASPRCGRRTAKSFFVFPCGFV